MSGINIYPGPIEIGDAVHDGGEVFVGIRFTDVETGEQATIVLSPESFDTFVSDLNKAATDRGRKGSSTH